MYEIDAVPKLGGDEINLVCTMAREEWRHGHVPPYIVDRTAR
jgi:hypothetical protein